MKGAIQATDNTNIKSNLVYDTWAGIAGMLNSVRQGLLKRYQPNCLCTRRCVLFCRSSWRQQLNWANWDTGTAAPGPVLLWQLETLQRDRNLFSKFGLKYQFNKIAWIPMAISLSLMTKEARTLVHRFYVCILLCTNYRSEFLLMI